MKIAAIKNVLILPALTLALWGCDLLPHGGDPTPVTPIGGVGGVFASNMSQIVVSGPIQADSLWSNEFHNTPLDLTAIISVPSLTITSISLAGNGTIVVSLAAPLVSGTSATVFFDTTKTFHGTGGSQPGITSYKYRFTNSSAQLQHYP